MSAIDDIKTLIAKAAKAHDSADAMRFAQAAANAANACHALPIEELTGHLKAKVDEPEVQQY